MKISCALHISKVYSLFLSLKRQVEIKQSLCFFFFFLFQQRKVFFFLFAEGVVHTVHQTKLKTKVEEVNWRCKKSFYAAKEVSLKCELGVTPPFFFRFSTVYTCVFLVTLFSRAHTSLSLNVI